MALGGSRPRSFLYSNPPLIDTMEDELTGDLGPVGGLHSDSTSPAASRNPTSGPNLVSALILTPVPALATAPVSTNELFKQFMKAYL